MYYDDATDYGLLAIGGIGNNVIDTRSDTAASLVLTVPSEGAAIRNPTPHKLTSGGANLYLTVACQSSHGNRACVVGPNGVGISDNIILV